MYRGREHHTMDRRTFLKAASVAVAAGPGLAFGAENAGAAAASVKADGIAPVYRTLGRTGLKIAVVGMGALEVKEAAIFQAGFDRGVNLVDTARAYLDGKSEKLVGEALEGYRDKVHVATKIMAGTQPDMERAIQQSFEALKMDSVDLFSLHRINSADDVNNKVYRAIFGDLRKRGKARFIGVSAHENEAVVLNAVADDPEKFWDTALVTYNFKSDAKVKAAIARAAEAGVGVIAMKTQAGGYETKEFGDISPHQAALKWVLQDPHVTAAIPGMVNLAQLMENLAVMGMKLSRADAALLEQYGRAIAPYYCHRCGTCRPTCPAGVRISEVNRSLMYAEGYRNLELARAAYREIPAGASASVCGNCARCAARCPHGINIGDRMRRARELLA